MQARRHLRKRGIDFFAPFERIDPNTCMWDGVQDVINRTNFFENRPNDFGASRPRNLAFAVDFAGRPYNTLTLPCQVTQVHVRILYCSTALSIIPTSE